MKGTQQLESTHLDIKALIDRFRGPIVGLFAAWGTGWRDAEDLAQDVFVEAYFSFARFRGNADDPKALGSWLRGIARNLHYDYLRRRVRDRKREELSEGIPDNSATGLPHEPSPVLRAMEALPEKDRTVLFLHYLEDTPVRIVASLLETTEKSVESRLFRARQKLQEQLRRQGWRPGSSEVTS